MGEDAPGPAANWTSMCATIRTRAISLLSAQPQAPRTRAGHIGSQRGSRRVFVCLALGPFSRTLWTDAPGACASLLLLRPHRWSSASPSRLDIAIIVVIMVSAKLLDLARAASERSNMARVRMALAPTEWPLELRSSAKTRSPDVIHNAHKIDCPLLSFVSSTASAQLSEPPPPPSAPGLLGRIGQAN